MTALVFLCLMVVDPALSTLTARYVQTPVQCKVVLSRHLIGGTQRHVCSPRHVSRVRHERVRLVLVPGGLHGPALGV